MVTLQDHEICFPGDRQLTSLRGHITQLEMALMPERIDGELDPNAKIDLPTVIEIYRAIHTDVQEVWTMIAVAWARQ